MSFKTKFESFSCKYDKLTRYDFKKKWCLFYGNCFYFKIPKLLKEEGFIHRSRNVGKNFKFEVDAISNNELL